MILIRQPFFITMKEELKQQLITLADKYENSDFIIADPSQFLYHYKEPKDAETASFVAALLSFGNRKQFIPKIKEIFSLADKAGGFAKWLTSSSFESDFKSPDGNPDKKFYRFYSYEDLLILFRSLLKILKESNSLGEHFKNLFEKNIRSNKNKSLAEIISDSFPECTIVPKGKSSPNKRIQMYLRWMVRKNSPVDLGLWNWYSPSKLLIPLDTHVLQQAKNLGLIPENSTASLKTAVIITEKLKEIWPDDPCKGDFALFGLGVNSKNTTGETT